VGPIISKVAGGFFLLNLFMIQEFAKARARTHAKKDETSERVTVGKKGAKGRKKTPHFGGCAKKKVEECCMLYAPIFAPIYARRLLPVKK